MDMPGYHLNFNEHASVHDRVAQKAKDSNLLSISLNDSAQHLVVRSFA